MVTRRAAARPSLRRQVAGEPHEELRARNSETLEPTTDHLECNGSRHRPWRIISAVKITKDNPEVPFSLVWRVVIGFGSFPFLIFLTTYFEAPKWLTLAIVSVVFAITIAPIKAISRRKTRTESAPVDISAPPADKN